MPHPRHLVARFVISVSAVGTLMLSGCAGGSQQEASSVTASGPAPSAAASASASPSSSPTAGVSPTPAGNWIELSCTLTEDATDPVTFRVPVNAKGRYDFRTAWKAKPYDCDVSAVNGSPQTQIKPVTAVQKAALKAAEYDEPDIAVLISLCGQHNPDDVYLRPGFAMSEAQATEMTGALKLCPSHPDAAAFRAAMQRGKEEDEGESGGTEVRKGVHPGAFCSPEGARGYTSAGTLMKCSYKSGDSRARWRRA